MKHTKRGARNQTSARQAAGRGRGGGVAGGGIQQGMAAPGIGMSIASSTAVGSINNNSVITTAVNQHGGVVTNLTVPDLGSLNPVAPSQVVLPTQPYQQMVNVAPQTVTAQMGTAQPQYRTEQYQQLQQQPQQHHQIIQQHQQPQQQQQMHLLQPGQMTGQKLIRRGHQIELLTQAKFLCDRQDFVDLTIYCEDGVVRAHQMLLAVASPFLKLLFQTSPLYGTDEISLILPEVKACLVQALIHFVYTGTVVSKEDHFYSLMKLVYALNINASIEAESTNDRPTTFTAPLVPQHSLNPVLRLPQQTPQYLAQQQNLQIQQQFQPQQQHFQQPQLSQQHQQLHQNQLLQNSLPQAILPTQPVPLQQAMNGVQTSTASASNAAALVAQITQPAMAPPNKAARLSGPPANAVPLPPQNLPGLTNLSPSKLTTNGLPNIQLPTQPVPMVNGVLKGSDAPAAGQVTQQHLQQTVTQQQVQQQQQQQQQFAIAVDPTTGISYKVDMTNGQMCATSELTSSDPLAAIMNETIFTDTSGAIVPAPNAALYTTDNGQVIYTTQPPPNATATIPTNMQISQGTQLMTSPSGNIQLASPHQIQSQQIQQQSDVSIQGANANRGRAGAGGRGGRGAAGGNRGTKRKNPSNSQTQNNNQVNNTNLANNNRTTTGGVLVSADDDASVLAESVDDLPCAPDDEDINTPYPCPSCNKTIKGRVMLQAHHFQEHYDNPELGNTMQASGNDKHACRVCLKFFTRNSDVKAHILRVHCGDRRYPCTMCGKRFKESTHLRKHLYTHTGERPHYCSLCNKGFQTSSDLKRHKRTRVHQERVEQAGGIDPIDTAVPQTGTGNNAATQGGVGAPATGVIKGWSDTDDDSSVSGVQITGGVIQNASGTSSVSGGGQNDAGTTAQALLNSITEPVPVVPSVPSQSMVGTSAATSVVTMVAPANSKGGSSNFSNNASTIDMKIIGGQHQQPTYVNNTSGGGIVAGSSGQQPGVSSVGGPMDLKSLGAGAGSAPSADAAADMADMNAFIENAAREVTGSSDSASVSSMPVVSTNGGPPLSLAHDSSALNSTTAATVVVSTPGTVSQNSQHSLNMSGASGGGNVVNHQAPMVVSGGPSSPTESDLPRQGMPVVTTEASSSSLIHNTQTTNNMNSHVTENNKTGLIQSLGSGRTSSQPATVIVSASHSSNSSMPTLGGSIGSGSNQAQKTNSAFDDLKRTSSLDSPGHDEERLTVVETMDDSSQELSSNSARHPTPAAVVVPLIKSKVDSSSPSS